MLHTHKWYWRCNGKNFYTKIQAISENIKSQHPISFEIPDIYTANSMCSEPAETWEQIMLERALEIRLSYPYINLMYSAGCDSEAMLQTFLQNNIHLDEISVYGCGLGSADHESTQAVQNLKAIKHLIPNTKISYHVTSLSEYKESYRGNKSIYNYNGSLPHTVRLIERAEDTSVLDKGDTVINIFGKEKPTLVYVNNKWYTFYLDNCVDPRPFNDHNSIYFYSDNVKVHAKQAHMLKNYIQKNLPLNEYDSLSKIWNIDQRHANYATGRLEKFNSFFIPKRVSNDFFTGKDGKQWAVHSWKDQLAVDYIDKTADMSWILDKWKNQCDELVQQYGTTWFNRGRPENGSVGVFSKFYCLDRPEVKTIDDLYPHGVV